MDRRNAAVRLALAALTLVAAETAHSQSTADIHGREARVWATGAGSPITGRVALVTDTHVELDTGAPFCGSAGCVRSFTTRWSDVDRMQVVKAGRTERLVRAAVVGAGIGLLLGPGLNACNRKPKQSSIESCTGLVMGGGVALGAGGFLLTRRTWRDVPIPQE